MYCYLRNLILLNVMFHSKSGDIFEFICLSECVIWSQKIKYAQNVHEHFFDHAYNLDQVAHTFH